MLLIKIKRSPWKSKSGQLWLCVRWQTRVKLADWRICNTVTAAPVIFNWRGLIVNDRGSKQVSKKGIEKKRKTVKTRKWNGKIGQVNMLWQLSRIDAVYTAAPGVSNGQKNRRQEWKQYWISGKHGTDKIWRVTEITWHRLNLAGWYGNGFGSCPRCELENQSREILSQNPLQVDVLNIVKVENKKSKVAILYWYKETPIRFEGSRKTVQRWQQRNAEQTVKRSARHQQYFYPSRDKMAHGNAQ